MAGFVDIRLEKRGAVRLQARLEKLDRNAAARNVRKALRVGAKVLQRRAKQLAPRKTGALSKAIKVRSAGRRKLIAIHVRVGAGFNVGQQEEFYGAFQEYGTGERITRRGRKTGRVPGSQFMQKAFDQQKENARTKSLNQLYRLLFDGVR